MPLRVGDEYLRSDSRKFFFRIHALEALICFWKNGQVNNNQKSSLARSCKAKLHILALEIDFCVLRDQISSSAASGSHMIWISCVYLRRANNAQLTQEDSLLYCMEEGETS